MSILAVRRIGIKLGEIPLNVYHVTYDDGTEIDLLAGRNVTDAVDMRQGSLTEKMKVKSLKDLPNVNPSLTALQADTGEIFTPVSIKDAAVYWGMMSQAKNEKATAILVACTIESIESRVKTFLKAEDEPKLKPEIEAKLEKLNAEFDGNMREWIDKRAFSMSMHPWFQQHCIANRYPAWDVHDAITKAIFDQTAEEARQNPLVMEGLDPSIGLNHQEDPKGQDLLARVKRKFCLLKNGTWQEKVNRAVSLCCN